MVFRHIRPPSEVDNSRNRPSILLADARVEWAEKGVISGGGYEWPAAEIPLAVGATATLAKEGASVRSLPLLRLTAAVAVGNNNCVPQLLFDTAGAIEFLARRVLPKPLSILRCVSPVAVQCLAGPQHQAVL